MLELSWGALDSVLIRIVFVYSIYLLFVRSMGPKAMALIAALVFLLGEYDPLYQAFFEFWPERNPQISTLIYAAILVPMSVLQLCIPKRRTADRGIMTMSLCAVVATTLLFHSLFVTGILPQWRDSVNTESQIMMGLNQQAFNQACLTQRLQCSSAISLKDMQAPALIKQGLLNIERDVLPRAETSPVLFSYAELNDIQTEDIAFITYKAYQGSQRVVIAAEQAEWAHQTVKQLFYFLASVAHATWILMGCGLILLHHWIMARRRK